MEVNSTPDSFSFYDSVIDQKNIAGRQNTMKKLLRSLIVVIITEVVHLIGPIPF